MPNGTVSDQLLPEEEPPPELTTLLVVLFAVGSALGVAVTNYPQLLLPQIQNYFGVDETAAGLLVTVSNIGYAFAILLIMPAADFLEQRRLICIVLSLAIVFMLVIVASPNYFVTLVAFFCLGVVSVTPQLLVPIAAHMAKPERRARVLGSVICGVMFGVLGSRVLSGFLGKWFGWKTVFWVAAIPMAIYVVTLRLLLPECRNSIELTYGEALKSLLPLFIKYGQLRYSATGAMGCFGTLSMFWTAMVYLLRDWYGWGADIAGLFGLVGLFAAVIALLAGGLIDKKGPFVAVSIGIACQLVSWIMLSTVCWWLAGLIVTVLVLDGGVQCWNTGLQTITQSLTSDARSRVTGIWFFMFFVGASVGSVAGAALYQHYGWLSVGICGTAVITIELIVHLITQWGQWRVPPPGRMPDRSEEEALGEMPHADLMDDERRADDS